MLVLFFRELASSHFVLLPRVFYGILGRELVVVLVPEGHQVVLGHRVGLEDLQRVLSGQDADGLGEKKEKRNMNKKTSFFLSTFETPLVYRVVAALDLILPESDLEAVGEDELGLLGHAGGVLVIGVQPEEDDTPPALLALLLPLLLPLGVFLQFLQRDLALHRLAVEALLVLVVKVDVIHTKVGLFLQAGLEVGLAHETDVLVFILNRQRPKIKEKTLKRAKHFLIYVFKLSMITELYIAPTSVRDEVNSLAAP